MEPTKRCPRCGETKPPMDFNRRTKAPDGLRSECRICQSGSAKRRYDRLITADPGWTMARYRRYHPNVVGHGRWGARIDPEMPTEMTEAERDVLVGSLLGDASLSYSKRSITAVFRERKTMNQAPYLAWKADQLQRFKPRIVPHMAHIKGKDHPGVFLDTPGCSVFNELYPAFYDAQRKKRLIADVANWLTPRALAVWLQDDGWLIRVRPHRDLRHPYMAICSESFSYDEQANLVGRLNMLLGERCSITKLRDRFRIHFGVKATRRMAELCAPFWHPCMAYKFPYPELLS